MGDIGEEEKREYAKKRKFVMEVSWKVAASFRAMKGATKAGWAGTHTVGGGRQVRGTARDEGRGTLFWCGLPKTACVACVGVCVGCGRRRGRWIIKNGRSGLRRGHNERKSGPGSRRVQ